MFLEQDVFKKIIDATPLISIDLVIQNSDGKYLLGLRNNRPAQGFWFVPGGRVFKNETLDNAFIRIAKEELGVNSCRNNAEPLGVFEHFYEDCVFDNEISTHYVVLGYKIVLDIIIDELPDSQHQQYIWLSKEELLKHSNVHLHSKWYFSEDLNKE
jgi:colanic acid biosynthesis protein WcaH